MGVMATLNQTIDREVAQIVAEELVQGSASKADAVETKALNAVSYDQSDASLVHPS